MSEKGQLIKWEQEYGCMYSSNNGGYYTVQAADHVIDALASRLAEAEQLATEYRRQAEEQRGKVAEAERRVKELEGALSKRIEWLTNEAHSGGNWEHLNARRAECAYILDKVRHAALSPRHQSAEGAEGEGT